MKAVFADTGYWIATLNPKDDWHGRAIDTPRALGKFRLITTEMVLDEFLAALSKVPVRALAITGADAIRNNPNTEVVPQTSIQCSEAFSLYLSAAAPRLRGPVTTVRCLIPRRACLDKRRVGY